MHRMEPLRSLAFCVLAISSLACNTTYYVKVRTFPPTVGEVYIDGEHKGTTSERGDLTVDSGKKSIFSSVQVSLEWDGQRGVYLMGFSDMGAAIAHVAGTARTEVGNERHYDLIFSFANLPISGHKGTIPVGTNHLTLRNPNDVPVWASMRREGLGRDFIVAEDSTTTLQLPDGDYDIYFIYADEPDELVEPGWKVHLDGNGGSVDLPPNTARLRRTTIGHVGVWQLLPETHTYVNFKQNIQLTFPDARWQVHTGPEPDLPWMPPRPESPYHVLIAVVPDLAIVMQVMVMPFSGGGPSLEDFLAVMKGRSEMEIGAPLDDAQSEVLVRGGERIGVATYRVKGMRFFFVVFKHSDKFTLLSFNCFEDLYESRKEEFWTITDSLQPAIMPGETKASGKEDFGPIPAQPSSAAARVRLETPSIYDAYPLANPTRSSRPGVFLPLQ